MQAFACPLCGLEEPLPSAGESTIAFNELGFFLCEGCGARYVHGRLVPRVVVEPHDGGRGLTWARLRIQDPSTKVDLCIADLDPNFALMLARNILEIVPLTEKAALAFVRSVLSKV